MYKIGVDLGGTNIAAGITNSNGELILKDSIKTKKNGSPQEIIKDIFVICNKVMIDKNLTEEEIKHIGIGVPGTCSNSTGIVSFAPNINFKNINLRSEMANHTKIPISIENDANCAALGESIKGAAKDYKNSLTVTLGTGVGAGIVIDGNLIRGNVEVGHHTININGPLCGCGNMGCFESYASATSLIKVAREVSINNPTKILKYAGGDINKIEAKNVFDAKEENDKWAVELIKNYIFYLSVGINNLINCYPLQAVIIGGGISKQGDNLIIPLKEELKSRSFGGEFNIDILTARLGNDAGIIGSAELESKIS